MPNVIIVRRKRDVKISRNAKGDGVIKIDSDAADLLEKLLRESDGELSVRELASALILIKELCHY